MLSTTSLIMLTMRPCTDMSDNEDDKKRKMRRRIFTALAASSRGTKNRGTLMAALALAQETESPQTSKTDITSKPGRLEELQKAISEIAS